MSPPPQAVGLMRYGVMLFSIAYLSTTVITAVHIMAATMRPQIVFVAVFCYTHVLFNWIALFQYSNRDPGVAVEDGEKQNSSNYCPQCDIFKQRQSHHCSLCGACILKHDHHCFFVGTCIGLNNQPYFIVLCLYTALGSFYLCLQIFLLSDWVFNRWYNYLELVMPFGVYASLLRVESLYSAGMLIVFNFSETIGLFCFVMLGIQVNLLSKNVTWHEHSTNKSPHLLRAAWANFRANFRPGLLRFIVPVLPSVKPYYRRIQI